MPLPSLALNFCPFFSASVASGMPGLAPTVWGESNGKTHFKTKLLSPVSTGGICISCCKQEHNLTGSSEKGEEDVLEYVFAVSVLVPIPKEGKQGCGGCRGQGQQRACCKVSI